MGRKHVLSEMWNATRRRCSILHQLWSVHSANPKCCVSVPGGACSAPASAGGAATSAKCLADAGGKPTYSLRRILAAACRFYYRLDSLGNRWRDSLFPVIQNPRSHVRQRESLGTVHLAFQTLRRHSIAEFHDELDLLCRAGKFNVASDTWQKSFRVEGDGSHGEPDYFCASFGPLLRKDSLIHDSRNWFSDGGLHGTKASLARYPCGLSGAAATLVFLGCSLRRNEAQVFCSKCGAPLTEGTAFCSVCGTPVSGPSIAPSAPPTYVSPAIAGAAPAYPVAPIAALPSPYAGFWLRVIAAIIDSIFLGVPLVIAFIVLAVVMGIFGGLQNLRPDEGPEAILGVLGGAFIFAALSTSVLAGWIYFALMESSTWQGTLGKKAIGLFVTDLQGNRLTFARASGRYFGGRFLAHVPIFGGLYFFIDCIMAGLTSSKQAIHDMIAGCLVLRKM